MNINLYQILILTLSSIMLFQSAREFFKRESGQTLLKFVVRVIVWGGMAVAAIYPDFTKLVARIMGFEENINAVVIIGFVLIFLLIFKLLSAIEKIEQNISELTRKEALSHLHAPELSKEDEDK